MDSHEFVTKLRKLGFSPHQKGAAALLGVALRTVQGYGAGAKIPTPVAKLLDCLVREHHRAKKPKRNSG